jgi:16S rRNA A1518/A1519 N6-dimethyltransferase RsmA/KsgA/DIM1 with predicted DNA glycosylase/AP lyase activity
MSMTFFLIIFLILGIISLFSSPQLSPIPYFPSNKKDLPLIIKALNLKNNQVVFDLGAGDGIVIFEAAKLALEKKLNTRFVALEINPVLILIMWVRWLFHSNKKNIKIIRADIFTYNFCHAELGLASQIMKQVQDDNVIIYLYISPWHLEKVIKNLKSQIKNFSLVSYFYPIPKIKAKKIFQGKNKVFTY